jgi:hypothetical protein
MNPETKKKYFNSKNAKRVAKFVTTRTVSGTVVSLIHQNTTTYSVPQKVSLYIGAFLVGSMVADNAWDHTEKQIDDLTKAFKESKNSTPTVNVHHNI